MPTFSRTPDPSIPRLSAIETMQSGLLKIQLRKHTREK
jgi:hypothetical protein